MKRYKIMLVDDDENMLENIKLYMEAFGDIEIIPVVNPFSAISTAEHCNPLPDLFLIDLILHPKLHGSDIASQIRNNSRLKNIPIVFFTGSDKGQIKRNELPPNGKIGGDDFIIKGEPPDVLRFKLLKIIKDNSDKKAAL